MSAYYTLLKREQHDDGSVIAHYRPNIHAQGTWNKHEQHMGAATGIICSELAGFLPRENMRMGRVSLDIFGFIALDEFSIITRMARPGKTIELVEADMQIKGKTCISARAWKMMTHDTSAIAGTEDRVVTAPEAMPVWRGMNWPGGWIQSLESRTDESRRGGKGLVWLRSKVDMVEGQETPDFLRLLGMVDAANGVIGRTHPRDGWVFPNLDLQIHIHRQPQGQWLGIEAVQQFGSDGIGLTSAILHDEIGPFGRSEQVLTLRRISPKL